MEGYMPGIQRQPTLQAGHIINGDKAELYSIVGELEIRQDECLPPDAAVLIHAAIADEIITTDGAGAFSGGFALSKLGDSGTGAVKGIGLPMPILLKDTVDWQQSCAAAMIDAMTLIEVLSEYQNQAHVRHGVTESVASEKYKAISGYCNYVQLTTTAGSWTDVFKVNLGAEYTIKRFGFLGMLNNTGANLSYVRLGHAGSGESYTYGTGANVNGTTKTQIHPQTFDDISSVQYLKVQMYAAAGTAQLYLHWLPAWVARS